jgi:hypothetical protein
MRLRDGSMKQRATFGHKVLVATAMAAITAALFLRLPSFPGLHGDEAWVGLRALEQQTKGLFTLRGTNGYTGSVFPQLVTLANAIFSPGMLSLRLPGAVLNWLALLLMTVALWKRGTAALCFLLLMGSSLLFLFYSRVAWEVNALQNLLLSLIILALTSLLRSDRTPPGSVFLLLLAFALGTWNHLIFMAAALSFALAAAVVALKWPDENSARLLLLGCFNLVLQIALLARHFVGSGPFMLHALPALVLGFALVALFCVAYVRAENYLLAATIRVITRPPLVNIGNGAAIFAIAGSLLVSPTSVFAFFGTVSGIILLERVVSYAPGAIEMAGLHARMALMVAAFLAVVIARMRNTDGERQDQLSNLLMIWTIIFFPALMVATRGLADRYYVIPQFLFFCSIALAIDHGLHRWRYPLYALLMCGFVYAQATSIRETLRDDNRPPFETFAYGSYSDTSRHFLRLDRLSDSLERQGICRVKSSNFFIAQPMQFLMATRTRCENPETVAIEYCSSCGGPVAWFELTPARAVP